jgi:hypothetical protein
VTPPVVCPYPVYGRLADVCDRSALQLELARPGIGRLELRVVGPDEQLSEPFFTYNPDRAAWALLRRLGYA